MLLIQGCSALVTTLLELVNPVTASRKSYKDHCKEIVKLLLANDTLVLDKNYKDKVWQNYNISNLIIKIY